MAKSAELLNIDSAQIPEVQEAEQAQAEENEQEELDPNTVIASRLITETVDAGLKDTVDIYEKNAAGREVSTYTLDLTDKKSSKTLFMSELLVGHQDSALSEYSRVIGEIEKLPESEQPDLMVLSGFMQGDFKYFEKPRRSMLVPEFNSMDTQFHHARNLIRRAQETGVPVIYNMSDDDHRICEDYTVEAFKMMQGHAKKNKSINWAGVDKLRQHPMYYKHLQFQKEVAFPYCLRSGRRLYDANEMSDQTDGEISIDEYYILYNQWEAEQGGRPDLVPEAYTEWLEEVAKTQLPELIITDDVNVEMQTEGKTRNIAVRHYTGYSNKPMYRNHLASSKAWAGSIKGEGDSVDLFVTQNNHESVGTSLGSDTWVVSTPGLIDPRKFTQSRSSRTHAPGDISRRLLARGRPTHPGASMYELTDDGRQILTVFNKELLDKADSLPERLTIAEICDLQFGSISARPDILVKYLDIVRERAIGSGAIALFFGGDHLHGSNYRNFKNESQATGLIAMGSQEDFGIKLFRTAYNDVTPEELKAIQRVMVQPGNHEWNSGTERGDTAHGYYFTAGMRSVFERMYTRAGYSDEEIDKLVQSHEAMITGDGEYLTGTNAVTYFGAYGALLRHYMLDRGASSSGGEPIYQANALAYGGSAGMLKDVDLYMAGHFHHPQFGVFGNKLAVIGGSMAGVTDFEFNRGYKATIAGQLIHIGGGLPVQVEFISDKALHSHTVKHGGFTDAALKEEGFKTDRGFDPIRNGLLNPDSRAKRSAIQKKVLDMMRRTSLREGRIAYIG